jgi:hypothetical protein
MHTPSTACFCCAAMLSKCGGVGAASQHLPLPVLLSSLSQLCSSRDYSVALPFAVGQSRVLCVESVHCVVRLLMALCAAALPAGHACLIVLLHQGGARHTLVPRETAEDSPAYWLQL